MTLDARRLLVCAHESITGTGSWKSVRTGIAADGFSGLFVTLWYEGTLRGCMGEIRSLSGDLGAAVARVARMSACEDPRFAPVEQDEAAGLHIDISLLEAPEVCTEADLDPAVYGVMIEGAGRRGVLLPGIEGVETVSQQLAVVRRKAGIGENEPFSIKRFRIMKISDGAG